MKRIGGQSLPDGQQGMERGGRRSGQAWALSLSPVRGGALVLSLVLSLVPILLGPGGLRAAPARGGASRVEPESRAVILDGILVVVNGQPITRSRAELFQALLQLWQGDLGWPMPVKGYEQLSPQELERLLILDELLFEGASGVGSLKVPDADVKVASQQLKARLGSPEAWQVFAIRYELSDDALQELMTRRLRVRAWIQLKVGTVRVSELDVRAEYEAHASSYPGQTFEQARAGIEAAIKQTRQAERFEQWVEGLRERASIQVPSRESGR